MMVSIIILNYNTFNITCECIESVLTHTSNIHYELIVVDNASDECDPALFKTKFPSIILVENMENLGFAKGNNTGILRSKGEYILLLNSDVILKENSIAKLANFLRDNPAIGIVSPKLFYPDGKIQYLAEKFPSMKNELLNLFRINKLIGKRKSSQLFLSYHYDHQKSIKADYVWGAFFMFKKEVLATFPNKMLNDDFFMYAEDMLWCYEAKKAGYETWYFADTSAIHIHSYSLNKSLKKNSQKKIQMMILNKYNFLKKEKGFFYTNVYRIIEFLNMLTRNQISTIKYLFRKGW